MSMRQYDVPTENGWTTVRVELQDREYKIFLNNQLYRAVPDVAPTFRLQLEQKEVDIEFRTPKKHRVLVNGTPLKKVQKEFASQHKMWNFSLDGRDTNFTYEISTKKMFMNGEEIKMATFGNFSIFNMFGSNFHFWDRPERIELKMGDEIVSAYQLKNR